MTKIILYLLMSIPVVAFAALFTFLFIQIPSEKNVAIFNAAQAETVLSVGIKLKIELKGPDPVAVVVKENSDEGFTTDDGHAFVFQEIAFLDQQSTNLLRNDRWLPSMPIERAKAIASPGETVMVNFRGPRPFVATIARKNADTFTTTDGQSIEYNQVIGVVTDVPIIERAGTALISIPFFFLWAFVDLMAAYGYH